MEEMDSNPFRQIKMEISTLADAASQILDLYEKIDNKKTPVLTVDYALISGFVRPDQSHRPTIHDVGFDRNIDFVGNRIFQLYGDHANTVPYQLAFSEPTVIEFEQSTIRMSATLKNIMDSTNSEKLFDRFMSFIDNDHDGSALETGIRDDELYNRAKFLFEHAKRSYNIGATNSLLTMIKTNQVQGLGEFYSEDQFRAAKSQIYDDAMKIFDFLNQNRYHGVNADFNNFIDSLNFSFAYHLNSIKNDITLSYVAPFPRLPRPTYHASRIRAMLDRRSLPASLLIELNARKFVAGQIKSPEELEAGVRDWIATLHDRAKTCREYISPASQPDEISLSRQREINLLYRDIMVPTFNGIESDDSASLRNIFVDHASFKKRFTQDIDETIDLSRGLAEIKPVIGSDELLSDLNLIDDPRIQKIRDKIIRSRKLI